MAMMSTLTDIIRLVTIIIMAIAFILPIAIIFWTKIKTKKSNANNQNDNNNDGGIKYY